MLKSMLGGFPLGCRNEKVTGKTDVSEDIRDRFNLLKTSNIVALPI